MLILKRHDLFRERENNTKHASISTLCALPHQMAYILSMAIDAGRKIDWGRTSQDYARYRPDPPQSVYEKLQAHGVGLPKQRILDLGTGTGALARAFAKRGCETAGVDLSQEQITMAQQLAQQEKLAVDFQVSAAEATPFPAHYFDVVTANQCWWYFDLQRITSELRRLLKPRGLLVVSHFSFLPRLDPIVRASEELILRFNPDWEGADWDGVIPTRPTWSKDQFILRAMFYYDEAIPFSRESWRGRMRALRGIGATLSDDEILAFDREHAALLEQITDAEFTIMHRIDAHIFELKPI